MTSRYLFYVTVLMEDHGSDWMSDSRVAEVKKYSGKINLQYKEPVQRKYEDGKDTGGNPVD